MIKPYLLTVFLIILLLILGTYWIFEVNIGNVSITKENLDHIQQNTDTMAGQQEHMNRLGSVMSEAINLKSIETDPDLGTIPSTSLISSMFTRYVQPAEIIEVAPEPIEMEPKLFTGFQYIGTIEGDSKRRDSFKDVERNTFFNISVGENWKGWELISIENEEFIFEREDERIKVQH